MPVEQLWVKHLQTLTSMTGRTQHALDRLVSEEQSTQAEGGGVIGAVSPTDCGVVRTPQHPLKSQTVIRSLWTLLSVTARHKVTLPKARHFWSCF